MKLSILIPSVHTRWNTFGRAIQEQIWGQYEALNKLDRKEVEILFLQCNKTRLLGNKRNQMLALAQGEYVAFVDDDDRLQPDYLTALLKATESGADVITFVVSVSLNGDQPKLCFYSKNFPHDENFDNHYKRIPNHIMCVKRELAIEAGFPNTSKIEDAIYGANLHPLLQTEHATNRVLYHYDYSDETTETQG